MVYSTQSTEVYSPAIGCACVHTKTNTNAFGKRLHGRRPFFTFLFVLSILLPSFSAAQRASIAFWNVENLYDTIPSPFYDDSQYTPGGARKWDTERYRAKIENLAKVLDEMAADLVGLAEVENEGVVRDLVEALSTDYNYIHRSSGDGRGMDLALLYKGDKFFPDSGPDGVRLIRPAAGREFLHVAGELLDRHVHLLVCHLASNLNSYEYRRRGMQALRSLLERLLGEDPAAHVIVAGDMNAVPGERVVRKTLGSVSSHYDFVYSPHWELYRAGKGSYSYRSRWYLYDWIAVSPSIARGSRNSGIRIAGAGVYAKEYMTTAATADALSRQGALAPLRTFYGRDYLGGYSDHFPVWMVLQK